MLKNEKSGGIIPSDFRFAGPQGLAETPLYGLIIACVPLLFT